MTDGRMQVEWSEDDMCTLSDNRQTVRLRLPPLPIGSSSCPVIVFMEMDVQKVDGLLKRLGALREQMLPPLRQ